MSRVVIGLSGGVDSSVAALLLKKQGFHVEAVFMQNWQESNDKHCTIAEDLSDAEKVCAILKIPLHTINFSGEYWQNVFQHFLNEYAAYRTPNPDVLCNKEIKFKAFLNHAKELGADYIATGHYARKSTREGKYTLLKGIDAAKDQSYFLHLLNQEQLTPTLFPIGTLTKQEIRAIAAKENLPNHAKKDSTGICFIGERKFKNFLNEYLLSKPGRIITTENEVIGTHDGIMFYTLGQRQGLNLGGQKNHAEAPWYVAAKNIETNELIVTQDRNHQLLMKKELICSAIHWIRNTPSSFPLTCTAKIRYRQNDQECAVYQLSDEKFKVLFTEPQWAITPGQSIVFYHQDECLGGAIID